MSIVDAEGGAVHERDRGWDHGPTPYQPPASGHRAAPLARLGHGEAGFCLERRHGITGDVGELIAANAAEAVAGEHADTAHRPVVVYERAGREDRTARFSSDMSRLRPFQSACGSSVAGAR